MQFDIRTGEYRGFPMLYVSGEIDLSVEAQLKESLHEVSGQRCALLNVNDVTYADASTVSVFIAARQAFTSRGGLLAFVCCDAQVLRVLQTLGLMDGVDIFYEIDEAADYLEAHCEKGADEG